MTGRERAFAVTTIIVVIFNVIGNLLAIPSFGATGAAFVTACSVAALNLWQYGLSRWRPDH